MTEADVRGYRLEMYRDPEDGSWVAEVPELPGCLAGGDSPAEAVEMVADAIDAWIEAAIADGRAVPLPRAVEEEYSGRFVLRIPRSLHARLARIARSESVSLNAYCQWTLAEAVGAADSEFAYGTARLVVASTEFAPSLARAAEGLVLYRAGGTAKAVTAVAGTSQHLVAWQKEVMQ